MANLFIAMSLFVFVSSALDVLLSGEQKRDLADKTTAALFVLAEVKSAERTIKILRNNRVQRWTSSFFAVPTILIGPWAAVQINFMGAQFVIFGMVLLLTGPKLIAFAVTPGRSMATIVRVFLFLCVILASPYVFILSSFWMLDLAKHFNFMPRYLNGWAVIAYSVVLSLWFSMFFVVPLLCIGIAALVAVLEIVVRRIAEYPKGPILAGSAIVGSLATLSKALWG